MSKKKRKFPALRLIVLSVIAGAVGGAIAVYVKGGLDGNNAATPIVAAAGDNTCARKDARAREIGAAATGEVAAMLAADPPRSLTALSFKGPEGEALSINDFAGKLILVNLWATWCVPCREEMPALDALQASMGSDAFEVVAVNVDRGDDEKPKAFLEETRIRSLGYYRDSSMRIFNDLKSQGLALGLPVTLLIDEEGCLIAHMNGPAEWAGADAARLIEAALPAKGPGS
ncbi:TlpA disulfide reductase family protein [Nitratireductor sp. ZSWI3]|uniref:thiol:disulfide interchange protein TlpA n=1 Tax=Nitratireductor sp. ZSWI3 TaxID=2966359 RepID=UPI0021503835|nr:TlpA disulfide reductase family protein [Nitratireductor sp. ZSWI3]MCR4265516.1 TlpA family protein disulfide reductase [Nitratireductor sp. ZSWI3]